MTGFTADDIPSQEGRTVLITGANTGIGWEAAKMLAARGGRILLACRSAERAREATRRLVEIYPRARVELVQLDLASLDSVRAAAEQLESEPHLDLLINNAGIMFPPREPTRDGFESHFGVNHLGHFALTGLLLPKLRSRQGSRVVSVSSNAHKRASIDFEDPHAERHYSRLGRYGMSKLANLLFTYELQRRLKQSGAETIALACHPGASMTDLGRHIPTWLLAALKPVLHFATHPPPEGAMPTVRAATDPSATGGQYYGPGGLLELTGPPVVVRSTAASHDQDVAARLWSLSTELTGVNPGI